MKLQLIASLALLVSGSTLLGSGSAWAGESGLSGARPVTLPVERLVPHQGGWWNPAQAGSGYFMEFSQNADGTLLGFATTYTYDGAGKSTFLIVQGPVVFTTEEERWATGIIARMSSPLYKAENGQPFDGTYRPATVTASSFGTGEYVFFTRRTGEFRAGGRTTPIRALSPLAAETEYARLLTGTWKLQGRLRRNAEAPQNIYLERSVSHVVQISPSVVQPTWVPGRGAIFASFPVETRANQFWKPTSTVMTFDVNCVGDCPPAPYPGDPDFGKLTATFGARIWVDVATGKAGYVTGALPFGYPVDTAYWATNEQTVSTGQGGTNWTFDLFVDDATLIGRGGAIVTHNFWPQGFHLGSEIVLTKVDPKTAFSDVKIY